MIGVEVHCPACGYRWNYRGGSGRTQCRQCRERIYIPLAERQAAGLAASGSASAGHSAAARGRLRFALPAWASDGAGDEDEDDEEVEDDEESEPVVDAQPEWDDDVERMPVLAALSMLLDAGRSVAPSPPALVAAPPSWRLPVPAPMRQAIAARSWDGPVVSVQLLCGHVVTASVDQALSSLRALHCLQCRRPVQVRTVSAEPPEPRPAWRTFNAPQGQPAPVLGPPFAWLLVPAGSACPHPLALPIGVPIPGRARCPACRQVVNYRNGAQMGGVPDFGVLAAVPA